MRLGPYSVVETVASSAFTVTYRAAQERVGRTVLVKALKPTVSAASPFAAALEREAAVLGRLDHEGVVRLYDLVRAPDALFLVLEDARATPLAAVIAAARPTAAQALAVALGAARAIAHAHARGVVHRAIDPRVVAIAPRGRVMITDWSSAEAAAARPADPAEPFEAADTLARPDFMAPEQILGEPADARSDVWSLGALLHDLFAGAPPFAEDDPRAVAQRIRGGLPAPLPAEVPQRAARIVARCLSKAPEDRHADAGALAAAIEEALAPLSDAPAPVLVSRALAAARLGEELPGPPSAAPLPSPAAALRPDVARAAQALAAVSALIVAGGAALRIWADPDDGPEPGGVAEVAPPLAPRDRGLLRVVAHPWAEVYVDGELVDTTPVGRPIPIAPGRHFVTFRHPSAADEQRAIKIAAGQTVFLDVTMRVDRGDAGAPKPDGGAGAAETP